MHKVAATMPPTEAAEMFSRVVMKLSTSYWFFAGLLLSVIVAVIRVL